VPCIRLVLWFGQVYEKYILGMLSNFDSLPLDRIHNMLKMFVSDETPCAWSRLFAWRDVLVHALTARGTCRRQDHVRTQQVPWYSCAP